LSFYKRIAVWSFHNVSESAEVRKWGDAALAKIARMGGKVRRTTFESADVHGHNAWEWAYAEPDLAAWLFKQKRDARVPEQAKPSWMRK
jgi:predicted peptidase